MKVTERRFKIQSYFEKKENGIHQIHSNDCEYIHHIHKLIEELILDVLIYVGTNTLLRTIKNSKQKSNKL